MHGHPFSGPMKLWWGRSNQPDQPRNLFHAPGTKPPPGDMFRAGDCISSSACVERNELHALMGQLDKRSKLLEASKPNPAIPSGYTYLLQFIAHDMIDSVPSISMHGSDVSVSARNARSAPLLLETLYGRGPEEDPHAYEFTHDQELAGLIPRTHLRVGPRAGPVLGVEVAPGQNPYCPFRDIARNPPKTIQCASRSGGVSGEAPSTMLTEVMLADPRNDAHTLISQLTILFQLLHNHVLSLVEGATAEIAASERYPPRELAYRRFHCARTIVTLIYRNIIKKDVLGQILDEDVHRRYVIEGQAPLDPQGSIPVEFTFGAFRFGHAMVREAYQVNSAFPEQRTSAALDLSASLAHRRLLPIKEDWCIDWARFFKNSLEITPNSSLLLQPRYTTVLATRSYLWPAKVTNVDEPGLMYRDLLSSAFAGVLSVPALIKNARDRGFEVEKFDAWEPRLRDWLRSSGNIPPNDVETLAKDPPLPFFVLFEAARIGRRDQASGGKCLGPLGSIIVAEGICGAMRNHSLRIDGSSLKERIQTCGRLLFVIAEPDQNAVWAAISAALSEIDEIETMTGLLEYMARANIFQPNTQRTANAHN